MAKEGAIATWLVSPDELEAEKPVMIPPPHRQSPRMLPRQSERQSELSPQYADRVPSHSEKARGGSTLETPREEDADRPNTDDRSQAQESVSRSRVRPSLGRERLFDQRVIGDIAKRQLETEERTKKEKAFTFDTSEYRFLIYNQRLKQRIESIWVYPRDAAARGIYGDLVIRFTILKNGELGSIELVRTSGHKSLDDAALKALRDGAPYWPLPKEWGMDAYTIEGLFIYTLYGYYIM